MINSLLRVSIIALQNHIIYNIMEIVIYTFETKNTVVSYNLIDF